MLFLKLCFNGFFLWTFVRFNSWFHDVFRSSSIKYLFCQLQKRSIFYSKICRKSKTKRSKNDQNIMKSAPNSGKNRPGDLLEALWRPLGCPRGPRLNFGSEKLVRWTPPGPPDGVHFSTCFQCKIHLIFCSIIGCIFWRFGIHVGGQNASKMGSEMEYVWLGCGACRGSQRLIWEVSGIQNR